MRCQKIQLILELVFLNFGSRDESNIVFSKNTVTGKTYFVIDTDYASHIMLSDSKSQVGIVSLESSGMK